MEVRELSIPHAWVFTPVQHSDERGVFLETYRHDTLEETVGHELALRQANLSVSARGVVRGVHYALVPPSQAKYVMVASGAALDFVIDLRVGSPTFGGWDSVVLDDVDRRTVYISEGLGHAFLSLVDDTVVSYLVSEAYNPAREHSVAAFDPALALEFGAFGGATSLSARDAAAPSLDEAAVAGLLPTWDDCLALYAELAT